MKLIIKLIAVLSLVITSVNANENYFSKAKELFEKEKYEDSKFLLQRSIVFNPKHSKSYLYLAKIFNVEENESEEIKNLKNDFESICSSLCDKLKSISERLDDMEAKNDS